MRLVPFLKLAIPLGTLAGLTIAYGVKRWNQVPEEPFVIERPPPSTFKPLVPPAEGHALEGKVEGPGGQALGDVCVWLRSGDRPSWTYTDAQGAFRIDDLGAGPWPAKVLALGHEPLDLVLEEGAAPVTIRMKTAYGPPPTLAKLPRTDLLGRCVLPEGFDANGFEVVLRPEHPVEIDAPLPRRARVDDLGLFRFDDLIVGRYEVRVLPAWAAGGSWPDLMVGVGANPGSNRFYEHSNAEGRPRVVLRLALGTIECTLLDERGEAVEGAVGRLALESDPTRLFLPVETDVHGHFVIQALPAAKYVLMLRAGAGRLQETVDLAANAKRTLELRLPPSATNHP